MAYTNVGSGFNLIGTRQSSSSPGTLEYFNTQTNQGFSDPNQLSSFVNSQYGLSTTGQNVFNTIQQGYTPVNLNPSPQTASTNLNTTPRTYYDVQSLLNQNQQLQQQFLNAISPSQQEQQLQQQFDAATRELQNFDVSLEGGMKNIMNKPIALEFQQGQEAALERDAGFTRSSLVRQADLYAQQLNSAQQLRQILLQRLQAQQQFGRDDLQTALQLQQITRQEQQAARDFALQNGVVTPYYNVGGTIYRTSDGKPYSSQQEFFADAGINNWSQAENLVQPVRASTPATDDIKEYKYAQQQGFGGTFLDYMQQKALLNPSAYDIKTNPLTGENEVISKLPGTTGNISGGAMRTDRNNNPTAMTTDVAKSLGLVEGVDYVRGDKFPGSSKLYTAKFLGDPVQTTIKALDTAAKDPKKQAFYTAHNEPRWRYIAMSDQKWLAMSDEQKRATIAQMYNAEGGNGSLTGGSKGSTIDQYLAQQEQNPQFIYTLSQDQQTVLRNAMLQRGMTIPEKLSDTTQNKLREARATFASADSLLKSIESLTKKVITATSPTQIPFQWLKRTIGGKTKSNSDAAVFASTINAFTSLLTRAAGEKGVLTDQDVLRIKQALPSLFDTKKVADQKLATLRSIYASIKQGAVDAYSVPGASASGVDLRTKYGY